MPLDSKEFAGSTVLWRYVPFIDLVNILEFNQLRFSSIASFRNFDRHEASLLEDYRQLWKALPDDPKASNKDSEPNTSSLESAAHMVHACCFHENSEESVLMWNSYPNAQIAVKTTVDNLQQAFTDNTYPVKINRIRYANTCAEAGLQVSKDGLGVRTILNIKHKGYSHEREIRLTWFPLPSEYISGTTPPEYHQAVEENYLRRQPMNSELAIQGKALVQAVALSPRPKHDNNAVICRFLKKHDIKQFDSIY